MYFQLAEPASESYEVAGATPRLALRLKAAQLRRPPRAPLASPEAADE
jgi:hypothetical protein